MTLNMVYKIIDILGYKELINDEKMSKQKALKLNPLPGTRMHF